MEKIRKMLEIEGKLNLLEKMIVKKLLINYQNWYLGEFINLIKNYDSFTFKQNEILLDRPIYLGFVVVEMSKYLKYETYYDKLQPYFWEKYIQWHYMFGVTTDTPIILKINEKICILKTDEIIIEEAWYQDDKVIPQWGYKKFGGCAGIQCWTSEGWKDIRRIIRHETGKKIYRIRTKHGIVDVTEDHILRNKNREIIKLFDLLLGDDFLHNYLYFGEPKITFDEFNDKIYNIEPRKLIEKEIFVKGFFLGDASSWFYKEKSGVKYCWHIYNLDCNLIKKLQRVCTEVWDAVHFKVSDIGKNCQISRILWILY